MTEGLLITPERNLDDVSETVKTLKALDDIVEKTGYTLAFNATQGTVINVRFSDGNLIITAKTVDEPVQDAI